MKLMRKGGLESFARFVQAKGGIQAWIGLVGSVLASYTPSFEMETLVSALEAEPVLRNSQEVVGCLALAKGPEGLKEADSAS